MHSSEDRQLRDEPRSMGVVASETASDTREKAVEDPISETHDRALNQIKSGEVCRNYLEIVTALNKIFRDTNYQKPGKSAKIIFTALEGDFNFTFVNYLTIKTGGAVITNSRRTRAELSVSFANFNRYKDNYFQTFRPIFAQEIKVEVTKD